jgi:hypothetical protein
MSAIVLDAALSSRPPVHRSASAHQPGGVAMPLDPQVKPLLAFKATLPPIETLSGQDA